MLKQMLLMTGIGTLIGWVTNYIAIKLLFKPYNPINILGFKIQGVIPKRRQEMAISIANIVDRDLISLKDITSTINSIELEDEITDIVDKIVEDKLKGEILNKIPMASLFINDALIEKIKGYIKEVIEENKEELVQVIVEKMEKNIDIKAMVIEKINAFSLEEVENMTMEIAKNELKHIEVIGAVLGAIIGFIQFWISQMM